MFQAIDTVTGAVVNLENAIVATKCPDCGEVHKMPLEEAVAITLDTGSDWHDIKICCDRCTARRQAARESEL